MSRTASVKRASTQNVIIPDSEESVFCPICQGIIKENDEEEEQSASSSANKEHSNTTTDSHHNKEEEESDDEKGTDAEPKKLYADPDYDDNDDIVRLLSCNHVFHDECITPWLTTNKALCPLCKRDFRNEIPVDVLKAQSV